MNEPQNIAVLGAGLMGHGIALTFAYAGHPVTVYDPVENARASLHERVRTSMQQLGHNKKTTDSTVERIVHTESIEAAVSNASIIIEAAPEKLELKQSLFAETEQHAPGNAVIASNTSVIQISKIVGELETGHRMLGTHWWNPPHQIPLVEVIKTEWTDETLASELQTLLISVGKKAVLVEKDVPGFIGNRLQHALWREAISLVENGICTADAVDDVVKASFGRRLAVLGPLENADLVGIELTQDIHRQVLFDLETTTDPSAYLQHLLDNGRTGMAAGGGFREWDEQALSQTKERIATHLTKLEEILPR